MIVKRDGFTEIHNVIKKTDRLDHDALAYMPISPIAQYNPWNLDGNFQDIYSIISAYTLVDEYRCFEIWKMVEQQGLKGSGGDAIQVGVWRGGTGALIAKKAAEYNMDVYLCDTFDGCVKAGENDPHYKGGEHADATAEEVQLLLDVVGTSAHILEGVFPEDTSDLINSTTKFSLCHIDVDTYESTKDITEWLWPRLERGGVIVYDDYGLKGLGGVTEYINENYSHLDSLVIYNLNGHAIVVKR
tara:strand:- start:13157 stop:13888 length:732 start_codon:yes stop_codon:yes gene_type:complete